MSSTLMVRMQERLQTSLVMIGTQEGLSSVWLLVFTVLLWLLFASIFLSNRKNQMNRWVLVAGIFFSVGVLKEYLYFGVESVGRHSRICGHKRSRLHIFFRGYLH